MLDWFCTVDPFTGKTNGGLPRPGHNTRADILKSSGALEMVNIFLHFDGHSKALLLRNFTGTQKIPSYLVPRTQGLAQSHSPEAQNPGESWETAVDRGHWTVTCHGARLICLLISTPTQFLESTVVS